MLLFIILFAVNAFIIVWAMVGYNFSIKIFNKILKKKENIKDYNYKPSVSVMIVAHNEEKVIKGKLDNVINNDYPKDKIEYIVASDFSTDKTNEIVSKYISDHPDLDIHLYKALEHKGKTNAQNEAQKRTSGEILVMTDANSIFEYNSISELISSFASDDIAYVCGKLRYVNTSLSETAASESLYWEGDLFLRDFESKYASITAGNGAIYACRNNFYHDFDPIECHDSAMPLYFVRHGMRSIYNPDALASEKAGEVDSDEFKRKVRMNRNIIKVLISNLDLLNIFKYGWFSYFYFGHRTCRYLLWLAHLIVLFVPVVLTIYSKSWWIVFLLQCCFYFASFIGYITKSNNKILRLTSYYTMTIIAQWRAVFNCITGKSKPTWESAGSTR